jgi:hypothetical protein
MGEERLATIRVWISNTNIKAIPSEFIRTQRTAHRMCGVSQCLSTAHRFHSVFHSRQRIIFPSKQHCNTEKTPQNTSSTILHKAK